MHDDSTSLGDFHGQVRLFPLPNLVLFPSVVQPLHIFEPRYRQLMADALAGDRLITMALLQPGWEEDKGERPRIYSGVCIGKIFKEEKLSDGRFNLLLHGAARAHVLEETATDKLYRVARVQLLHDEPVADQDVEVSLRERLGEMLRRCVAAQDASQEQLSKLLQSQLSLGTLCDLFSFALPIEAALKQKLLEEISVARRVEQLVQHLEQTTANKQNAVDRPFPPTFSAN